MHFQKYSNERQVLNASSHPVHGSINATTTTTPFAAGSLTQSRSGLKRTDDEQQRGFRFITEHPHRWKVLKLTNRRFWWFYLLALVHIVVVYLPLAVDHHSFTCNGFPDTNTTMNVSCNSLSEFIYDHQEGTVLKTGTMDAVVVVPCPVTNNETATTLAVHTSITFDSSSSTSTTGSSSTTLLRMNNFVDPLDIYKNVGLRIWLTMPVEDISFLWWIVCSVYAAALTLPFPDDDDHVAKRRAKFHHRSVAGVKISLVLYSIWKLSWCLVGSDLLFNVCSYSVNPRGMLLAAYYFYIAEGSLVVATTSILMRRVFTDAKNLFPYPEATSSAFHLLEEGNATPPTPDENPSSSETSGCIPGCESSNTLMAQQEALGGGQLSLLDHQEDCSPSLQI